MPRNYLLNKLFRAAIALLLLAVSTVALSQTTQAVYWIRYQNQLNFSKSFWLNNEVDNRRFFSPDVQTQFILHSRVHYRKNQWEIGGGLTGSWAYAQFPETPVSHPTFELRPVIELNYDIPTRHFILQQRVRIDHRFIEEDRDISIFDDSRYIARFRYRLQARFKVRPDDHKRQIHMRISEEIMVNDRENFFDQNRIYTSAEFELNDNLSLETGYIYIYQQRFARDEFFRRHVVRLSLLHRLYLY
jgi:hypothetical protein